MKVAAIAILRHKDAHVIPYLLKLQYVGEKEESASVLAILTLSGTFRLEQVGTCAICLPTQILTSLDRTDELRCSTGAAKKIVDEQITSALGKEHGI